MTAERMNPEDLIALLNHYLDIETEIILNNGGDVDKFVGDEMMELMDDCMSFPKLLVRVRRYRHCILRYFDENWVLNEKQMDDDMSELIQHEYDHLDGILATMRAIDNKSFVMKQ